MTTITSNGQDWLFVEVPEGAGTLTTERYFADTGVDTLQYFKDGKVKHKQIPHGNYTIHAISDTITEEQAAEVVEMYNADYFKYYGDDFFVKCPFATESFSSLLYSHNLTARYAVLKRI